MLTPEIKRRIMGDVSTASHFKGDSRRAYIASLVNNYALAPSEQTYRAHLFTELRLRKVWPCDE